MMQIVIIGAGGHGREVAEVLRQQAARRNDFSILGFIDDDENLHGKTIENLPVLGGWNSLAGLDRNEFAVICAVGFPEVRKRLVKRSEKAGWRFFNAISPLAYVSPNAKIGAGVMIFPHVFVSTNVSVGDHAIIHGNSFIGHDTSLKNYATVCPGVSVAGNVSVGEGCWLGIGSSVIQNKTIGDWTTVGAGAAVVRDLSANSIAVGVPARAVKMKEIV